MSKKKNQLRHTPINKHKKVGSQLQTQLGHGNIISFDWERDQLPEFLWIAALSEFYDLDTIHKPYYCFMDKMDEYIPDDKFALGFISDFSLIPENRRDEFFDKNSEIIEELFLNVIGRSLAFYPESAASWLIKEEFLKIGGSLNPDVELGFLGKLVEKLIPAKDETAGRLRTLPFGRIMKNGKLCFPEDFPLVSLLTKYPNQCNDDEKYKVESFARMTVNTYYQENDLYEDRNWPKYFWRHNFDLKACKPFYIPLTTDNLVTEPQFNLIQKLIDENYSIIYNYFSVLPMKMQCDLYNPIKDEILFGLFSRVLRLYCFFIEVPTLWARDIGGIFLRCMVDTAITFVYLAKCGTDEEFRKFKEYGQGQEKLLMLHMQDNYPNSESIDGRTFEKISEDLGGFNVELLDIELGHWTKKDTRRLATEAGMLDFYRMIYSPTSGDLHGNWINLKNTSLCHCLEPLHRYHRLPAFIEPPLYVNILINAQNIVNFCREFKFQVRQKYLRILP